MTLRHAARATTTTAAWSASRVAAPLFATVVPTWLRGLQPRALPARVGEAQQPGLPSIPFPLAAESASADTESDAPSSEAAAPVGGELVLASANVSRLESGFRTLISQVGAHAYALQETKVPQRQQPGVIRRLRRTTGMYIATLLWAHRR